MAVLEVKINLPDRPARDAEAAGLLTAKALSRLPRDAMRRQAAQSLLDGAARATAAGSKPLSMRAIQAQVDAVRKARRRTGKPGR